MKIFKHLFLALIVFFLFTFLTPSALALRTCSSDTGCSPGENCSEVFGGDQCVSTSGDRLFYITNSCTSGGLVPPVSCPAGFTCQIITRGTYCVTNEVGFETNSCPDGQERVDNECRPISSATTGPVEFTSPIGAVSPTQILGKIIKTVLGILGAIALFMFVWGGQGWMMSGGNPEKIKTARATLVWAVIGLVVVFLSYAAVDFVLSAFGV